MLLLIVESAKDVRMLTRVQKTNEVNGIRPIVAGVQIALLPAIVELATTKVIIQCPSTLLRVRLDQDPIFRIGRMIGRDQKIQCLIAIRIVFDLIGLRMR